MMRKPPTLFFLGVFVILIGLCLPIVGVALPAPSFEALALTDSKLVISVPSVVNIGEPIPVSGYLLYPDGSTDGTRMMAVYVYSGNAVKSDSRYPMQGGAFQPVWYPGDYAVKAYYVPGIINWAAESETVSFQAVGTPSSTTLTVTCSYHGEQRNYPINVGVNGAFGDPTLTTYDDKTPPFTFTYTTPRTVTCYVYHEIPGSGTFVGSVTLETTLSDGATIDIPLVKYLESGNLSPEDGGPITIITPTPTPTPVNTKTVTIDVSGSGTTSPDVGVHVYPVGTTITLTATPSEGYVFDYWLFENGVKRYSASTYIPSLSTDKTALAVFSEILKPTSTVAPTLSPTVAPTLSPTVAPTPIPTPNPTSTPTITPVPTYPPTLPDEHEIENPSVTPDYDVRTPELFNYVTIIGVIISLLGIVKTKKWF